MFTRSQQRKKATQNTTDYKVNRAEQRFKSHRNRTPLQLESGSESESLEGFSMPDPTDGRGAWNGLPPTGDPPNRMTNQTPGSLFSFNDTSFPEVEEQEQNLRAQFGLGPRNITATTSSTDIPRVSTTTENSAPASSYPNIYSMPSNPQRLSGLPPLMSYESSTDILLKALLVKLDTGFTGLNASLRNPPTPPKPPQMAQMEQIIYNLSLQIENLSAKITSAPNLDSHASNPNNPDPRSSSNQPPGPPQNQYSEPVNVHGRPHVDSHASNPNHLDPRLRSSQRSGHYQNRDQNQYSESANVNSRYGNSTYPHHFSCHPRDWKIEYDGNNEKLAVEFFCDQIEINQKQNYSDWSQVISALQYFLKGEARNWYFRHIRDYGSSDWPTLRRALIAEFRGSSAEHLLCALAKRKQGDREKFDNFYHAVLNIQDRISGGVPEADLIGILLENVRPELQKCLIAYRPTGLADFVNKCRQTDKVVHPHLYYKPVYGNRGVSEVNMFEPINKEEPVRSMDLEAFASRRAQNSYSFANTKCWNCDVVGHSWQLCEEPRKIFCFWCGFKNVSCRSCPACNSSNFRQASHHKEPPPSAPPLPEPSFPGQQM